MRPEVKDFVAFVAFVIFMAFVLHFWGCVPPKASQAEATYLAQQLACVERYETRVEIDDCRERVWADWGITQTKRKDAGR